MVDISDFVKQMRAENAVLLKNGAEEQAKAREALLKDLETYFFELGEARVDVRTAARLAEVDEETVRRAVRNGEIPDLRENPGAGAPILVRTSDISLLRGKKRARKESIDTSEPPAVDLVSHFTGIARQD